MNGTPQPEAAPTERRPAPTRWRRVASWAGGVAFGLTLVGIVASLPFTEHGSQWLLRGVQALLPSLQVTTPSGPLLGSFRAERLVWQLGNGQRLVLEQAGWSRPRLEHHRFWGLRLDSLHATRAALEGTATAQKNASASPLPLDLQLPVGLAIERVQVDRLDLPALGAHPVRDLRFALTLPAGGHVRHEVSRLSLRWERVQAEGNASIGADAPMLLKAQLRLRNDAEGAAAPADTPAAAVLQEDWQAQLQALGSLSRFRVQGRLRARGQSVDAEAMLRPAVAMPVESAEARMEGFDLAGLSHGWPHTALAGLVQARLGTQGQAAPLQVQAQLNNAAAGPWTEQSVPVRAMQLEASTTWGELGQGELRQLMIELGNARQSGGRLQGQGLWRTEGSGAERALDLRLQTRLQMLKPAELDPRAPPIELSGPARLDWRQPWPANGEPGGLGAGRLQADWTGRALRDTPTGAVRVQTPVRLQLDAEGTPEQLTLRHFEATTGPASWTAHGTVRRLPSAWALELDSTLQAFDPALWLGTAVALPPSRIDGTLGTHLQWHDGPGDWQDRLRGDASLQLQPSLLAGVPGQGSLTMHSADGLQAEAHLSLGTGADAEAPVTMSAEGRFAADKGAGHSAPAADRWHLQWQARRLDALSPWLRALAGASLDGQADGDVTLAGRWPAVTVQGQWHSAMLRWRQDGRRRDGTTTTAAQDMARVADQVARAAQRAAGSAAGEGVRATPGAGDRAPDKGGLLAVQDLRTRWQFGSRPDDRFELDMRAAQAQGPAFRLLATTVRGTGTMDQHAWQFQSTLVPQRTAANLAASGDGTGPDQDIEGDAAWALQLAADGGWALGDAARDRSLRRAAGGAPWGWQGRISRAEARRTGPPGSTGAGNGAASLRVQLDPTPLAVLHDDLGLRAGTAAATQLRLNETVLALETLRYETGTAGPNLDLQARLPSTAAVPLLTLVQPGFGWRGDLQVAGRIDVQGRPNAMTALVDLHRERGDLAVADLDLGTAAQTVGLSELSLKVQALDGRWTLQERIAGQRMGRLAGDFSATTARSAWWPGSEAPLRGQLDLDIAQLGYWGALLPTGWRLSGQLSAQARASGALGAPRFDGEVRGQHLAVRNVLQGIDWRESELHARLAGDALLLDRLVLQAGIGRLTAQGRATLGTSPTITLQARAEHFAALQRVDRRVVVSGQADLLVDASRLELNGQLFADEGRIDISQAGAPALSADVAVHRGTDAETALTPSKGPQRTLRLDVRGDLGRQFRLTGRGLNTRLAGQLRLTAANNRPLLQGTIRAEEGTYAAYGQKLGIDRGLVVFNGPIENPRLDVLATRTDISDVKVGVAITGTAQSPRVRLYSDPDMSDTDKLSWLLMGRPSDGLGRSDLALLQRAAYALLAGESDGPSIVQRMGLDNLSVSQSDTGTVQQTVVSLGKQLSSRWYLGYERSLQATTGTWLLTYKLAQRFTVRAQSGYQNALDLIWSWRWGLNE